MRAPCRACWRALAAVLLLTPPRCAAALSTPPWAGPTWTGPRHFTSSAVYSHGKTVDLPTAPFLDVGVPAQLEQVLGARVYANNLLLWTLSVTADCVRACSPLQKSWLGDAVAMVHQLNDVGFAHYVALAPTAEMCGELVAAWHAYAAPHPGAGAPPSCAWTQHPLKTGPNNLARGIWVSRYWLIAEVASRGISVLMHDLDMAFTGDPYAVLMAPPLSGAQLVVLPEGDAMNGGLCYVQGAHARGAVLWVLRQVERRSAAIHADEEATGVDPGWLNDQDVLADAMRVAQHNGSAWDWHANWAARPEGDARASRLWAAHPQPETPPTRLFGWVAAGSSHAAPAAEAGVCPWHQPGDGGGGAAEGAVETDLCSRWREGVERWGLAGGQLHYARLHVPSDDPVYVGGPAETVAAAPAWVFAPGGFLREGWPTAGSGPQPGKSPSLGCVTHLLSVETSFSRTLMGSHAGRLLVAAAQGFVGPGWALDGPSTKALLWLDQRLVDAAADAATVGPLRRLLRDLALLAAASDRLPVMPQVPCDAPWVRRTGPESPGGGGGGGGGGGEGAGGGAPQTAWGVRDHRLVVAGAADAPRCYVSDMGWDTCWPWAHLAWAFDDEARARAARPGTWRAASPPLLPGGTVDAPAWAAAAAALPAGPDGSPPDIVLASVGGGFPAAEPGSPPGAAWPGLPPDLAARVDRLAEVCSLLMCPDYCLVQNTRCDWRAAACVPATG